MAKIINEYFGQNIEDLSLTQINAYVLEYTRAQKAEAEVLKKSGPTKVLNGQESLGSLKKLGFRIGK